LVSPTFAASLDEQISQLNSQIANQQQVAAQVKDQANTLAGKVAQLNAQIGAVQAQLRLNRVKQQQTAERIAQAQIDLAAKKTIMNEALRQIYHQSQITPLEMLASSKSFSEYVDRQQYNDRVKDRIQEALEEINALKISLDQQQAELNVQISQQAGLSATLQDQQSEQAELLASARNNAAAVDADIKAKGQEVARLKAQQAAIIQAASGTYRGDIPGASGGRGGACDNGQGNGGYPMLWCNSEQDSMADNWGMYNRECVSWAAWRRSNMGRPVKGGWGNANQWDDKARAAGFRVDSNPEVGAVAQTDAGFYGHVAIVEAVKGGVVIVSEMNYDNYGHFRYGTYSASYFQYIH
jgi:surface antigen/peptidoglycan hydrolase CwlO-like protein